MSRDKRGGSALGPAGVVAGARPPLGRFCRGHCRVADPDGTFPGNFHAHPLNCPRPHAGPPLGPHPDPAVTPDGFFLCGRRCPASVLATKI